MRHFIFILLALYSCSESVSPTDRQEIIEITKKSMLLKSSNIIKSLDTMECQANHNENIKIYYALTKELSSIIFDFVDTSFNKSALPKDILESEVSKLNTLYYQKIDSIAKTVKFKLYPDQEIKDIKFSTITKEIDYAVNFYLTCDNILEVHRRFVDINMSTSSHDPCKKGRKPSS